MEILNSQFHIRLQLRLEKMESSKLKVEKRNKLYFNKFTYKAVCEIKGAGYTYYTNDLETFVARMEKWRDNKLRYGVRVMSDDWKEYMDEINLDQISKFITWRNLISKDKCMYRMQGDSVSFFSNDLSLFYLFFMVVSSSPVRKLCVTQNSPSRRLLSRKVRFRHLARMPSVGDGFQADRV